MWRSSSATSPRTPTPASSWWRVWATTAPPSTASRILGARGEWGHPSRRSEEHTSELQSLMRISYAVFCLKKKNYLVSKHRKQRDVRIHQLDRHRLNYLHNQIHTADLI